MAPSLLFTQCMQNDFVKPIGRYEPIPNQLHVGFAEALRLMGENPAEGPVARTMRWAYELPDEKLRVVHIRDWHDPDDPDQAGHLEMFGQHCLGDSEGADFAFEPPQRSDREVITVDASGLNDFVDTGLAEALAPYADQPCRVGLIGVWTEAKLSFLAYELRTRYPSFQLAVCSALCASSSRQQHFEAINQLERILGVLVYDSVGEFMGFLAGEAQQAPLLGIHERFPEIVAEGVKLSDTDRTLVRYLFRDCRKVELDLLDGGFSGNVVAGTHSEDMQGHDQVPHVVKIGPQDLMGKERSSFERIQHVLGNNAPQISEFADLDDRGAIKYRYASMGGTFSTTFQKAYCNGMPHDQVQAVLDTIFGEQLMRLYKAATLESGDLLEHYFFSSRWSESVRSKVEELLGAPATTPQLELLPGVEVSNICDFYEDTLEHLPRRPGDQFYQAYTHGDLNGANIILDGHDNVWLIDFFHTRRAHVLMDLIKLENDLLYIFTAVPDEAALRQAFALTDALMEVTDLAAPLPEQSPVEGAEFARCWATLRMLRGFYPGLVHASRDPLQLWVGLMRYAVHTLAFDESDALQKRWALYAASRCAEKITSSIQRSGELRVDWLTERWTQPGKLGLTILPGRRDYGRDLGHDMQVLAREQVKRVLVLLPTVELEHYGVGELLAAYREAGLLVQQLPILDQKACSVEDMQAALRWVEQGLQQGEKIVVHCVGGLGRSGMAAAALLKTRGASSDEAIAEVRVARSPRAIETRVQEDFVQEFPAQLPQS